MLLLSGACLAQKSFTQADRAIVERAVTWQIDHFDDTLHPRAGWVNAAFYRGLVEWGQATDDARSLDFLHRIGRSLDWGMLPRTYDADDLCIGQTYLRLYGREPREEMIARVVARVDTLMRFPMTAPLVMTNYKGELKPYRDRWGWCDALFMAPPVFAQLAQLTHNQAYLDWCFAEFQVTADSLYDRAAGLWSRDGRFIHDREANGQKVFWARGNGWVYAGLATMLEFVPESHPSYAYYLQMYREMTGAVLATQDAAGAWHSGLLDPASFPQPENSAAGFFVYGLTWGLNHGILTAPEVRRAALRGWDALKSHVDGAGMLGYVQPIGHAPIDVDASSTAPYGVGAFLLAATQMRELQ